jgi:hypothetical protein
MARHPTLTSSFEATADARAAAVGWAGGGWAGLPSLTGPALSDRYFRSELLTRAGAVGQVVAVQRRAATLIGPEADVNETQAVLACAVVLPRFGVSRRISTPPELPTTDRPNRRGAECAGLRELASE